MSCLSDARQHALSADLDHRARLRPQRLLQEQLHLYQRDARRADHRPVQGACRSHPRLLRGPLDRPGARREAARCRACAVDQLPPQPRDSQAQAGGTAPAPARGGCAAAGSVRAPASTARVHRAGPAQGAAGTGRGHPPVHPRPQPAPAGVGAGRAHHRARGGRLLPAADRDQDHERRLGQLLAPPDHEQPRSAPGDPHGVPGAAQSGGLAPSRRHQPLSSGLQDLARHRAALRRADPGRARGLRARRTNRAARRSSRCARPTAMRRSCGAS